MQAVDIRINSGIQNLFNNSGFLTFSDYVNSILQTKVDEQSAWDEFYAKINKGINSGYVKCDDEYLLKLGEELGISRSKVFDSWKSI